MEGIEKRWRYDIITEKGEQQSWTGSFKTLEKCEKWYNIHGKWWINEKKKNLKLVEYYALKSSKYN